MCFQIKLCRHSEYLCHSESSWHTLTWTRVTAWGKKKTKNCVCVVCESLERPPEGRSHNKVCPWCSDVSCLFLTLNMSKPRMKGRSITNIFYSFTLILWCHWFYKADVTGMVCVPVKLMKYYWRPVIWITNGMDGDEPSKDTTLFISCSHQSPVVKVTIFQDDRVSRFQSMLI